MLNPFDLPGPQFLIFYLGCIALSGVIRYLHWLNLAHPGAPSTRLLTDPYEIAYLQGGAKEAIRVAVATLAHRGALTIEGRQISTTADNNNDTSDPLEKRILTQCLSVRTIDELVKVANDVAKNCYDAKLVRTEVILSEPQRTQTNILQIGIVLALLIVAGVKIYLAIQRGKYNFIFLIMLAAGSIFVHLKLQFWKTQKGRTVVADLKNLFKRLNERKSLLKPSSANKDFAFLIAVFGLAAVSGEYAFLSAFRPQQSQGSSCSSSCGSSSCGGGCGGGGCGGCGG